MLYFDHTNEVLRMSPERLRSPQHDHAPKKAASIPVNTAQPESDAERILRLQRTIGNQATLRMTQTGMIQLGRRKKRGKGGGGGTTTPTPTATPTLSQEEIRKRIAAGQKRRAQEKAAQNSWGSWFASWLPGGTYEAPSEDTDEDEAEVALHFQDTEVEGDESVFTGEVDLGEESEEAPEEIENPFSFKQLELDLGTGKLEKKGTSVGDVSASGKRSVTGDGAYNLSGKASSEGRAGKAEGEGKIRLSSDNLEGEGKASMLFGASGEKKSGTLGWGIGGHKLEGSGTMESKVGLSGDLAGKLAYSSTKFAAEGKMGAFLGALAESTVNIRLKSGGKDLGSTQGKIGIAYGAGGELSGSISWEGGKFEFGWKGKLVAGMGFSYGYKVTINTDALATTMTGWLPTIKYWLWDAWSLPDDVDLDDILII
jgi:hypothetical protein